MKKYLLFMMLVSCGNYVNLDAEETKKKAEEAKTATATKSATETSMATNQNETPRLKLKMGMNKEEVQKVLGVPHSVTTYTSFTIWYYDGDKCSNYSCSVQFTPKTGVVEEVDGIDSDYLDLESF